MAPSTDKIKTKFDAFVETKIVSMEKKLKIIIWAAVMVLPIVAFVVFFYSPKNKEIKSLEKQRTALHKEISEAKDRANQLDKHKAEMKETELKFQQASILLPQMKEIPSLLTNISSLGTASGLDVVSFRPRGEVRKEFYAEIPVDISVRGPYHNVGTFLYQVSKLERIVTVANIKLGSPVAEKGEMLLKADFTLVTYRFIETSDNENKNKNKKKKK